MAYLIKKGSATSPESTVTSLLANWSLKSSQNSSIQYKNKLYTSASQALEDYIEDFDLSRTSPDVKPGKISFTPNVCKASRCMKESSRGKRALGNSRAVVDPAVSQRRRKNVCDTDLLSLTTDDLLAFPADGSLSFTHTRILRSLPQSNIRNRKSLPSSTSCDRQRTSSLANKEKLNFPQNPIDSPTQKDFSRILQAKHTLHKYSYELSLAEKLTEEEEREESDLHKCYPRWLTGQKSDLCISGISSIPDFKYPMWLRSNNLLPDSINDSSSQIPESDPTFFQDIKTFQKSQNASTSGQRSGHSDIQRDTQHALPSVSFAPEEIRDHRHLFRDEATELLLQNPRKTLKSADELTNALGNDGSPCTVDALEAERSWDNIPVGLKSPVPVCCEEDNSLERPKASIVNEFLEDCLKSGQEESTFSGGNHHGPVEALKFMLFNLQAVQHSLNQKKTVEQNEEVKTDSDEDVEFNLCGGDTIPVRKSLQRALHHLSRLKNLVEDTGGKNEST